MRAIAAFLVYLIRNCRKKLKPLIPTIWTSDLSMYVIYVCDICKYMYNLPLPITFKIRCSKTFTEAFFVWANSTLLRISVGYLSVSLDYILTKGSFCLL